MPGIHPSAVVHQDAVLAADVIVGPFSVIGPEVRIGAGTVIGPHTRIERSTEIGERNQIAGQLSLGTDPQDFKYHGENTRLVIGDDNVFREFVTVNRGTPGGPGITRIGSHNFLMAYAHVAHDCHLGSHVIFANGGTLAGHVEVEDHATIGAFTAVHQFCRVGSHAFLGGYTVATQDVLPFVKTVGARPAKSYGVNNIGLQRKGFSKETIEALKRAYRILVRSRLSLEDAVERIERELGAVPEVAELIAFVRRAAAARGFIR